MSAGTSFLGCVSRPAVARWSWLCACVALAGGAGCADVQPNDPLAAFSQAGTAGQAGMATGPSESGSAGVGLEPYVDIQGFWAIYAQEMDGTVVSLSVDRSKVTGRGCLSGWVPPPDSDDPLSQCGEITGTAEGNTVRFEFNFGGPGPENTYGVKAQLLEGGERMNGEHYYYTADPTQPDSGAEKHDLRSFPATVFRPPPASVNDRHWPWDPPPDEVGSALQGARVSLPTGAPAGEFTPGVAYALDTAWGGISGDLGVFAPVDLSYDYPEPGVVVVNAGPAPQADPGLPVRLVIEVRDQMLVSVQAELPDGQMSSFAP
jgi:hypothetical protein